MDVPPSLPPHETVEDRTRDDANEFYHLKLLSVLGLQGSIAHNRDFDNHCKRRARSLLQGNNTDTQTTCPVKPPGKYYRLNRPDTKKSRNQKAQRNRKETRLVWSNENGEFLAKVVEAVIAHNIGQVDSLAETQVLRIADHNQFSRASRTL